MSPNLSHPQRTAEIATVTASHSFRTRPPRYQATIERDRASKQTDTRRVLGQNPPHLSAALVAIAAILCSLVPIACQPAGRPKKVPVYKTDAFKAAIETFKWPARPSHVIDLKIAGRGSVRVGLYAQLTPITVAHVVDCATRGVYDDTLFHRVVKDFMIQGGDPETRKRGPDTTAGDWQDLSVADEFVPIPLDRGVVAMANRGRAGSAATQFFIVTRNQRELDGRYTAFGRVISGMEIVDAISEVKTDKTGRWGKKDRPLENVILLHAVVEADESAAVTEVGAVPAANTGNGTPNEMSEIAERG